MVFKLTRTDADSPHKIKLPPGTHLIGRGGNILECTDKRISRNHGHLHVTYDELTLKSLHQNPCYFIKKNVSETEILRQDCELSLHNGDRFGLLPDSYWYEVLLCNDIEAESPLEVLASDNINVPEDNSDTEEYSDNELNNCNIKEPIEDVKQSESQSLISAETSSTNIKLEINADIQNNQENNTDSSRDVDEQEPRSSKRLNSDVDSEVEEKKVKLEKEDVKPNIAPGCSENQASDGSPSNVLPTQRGRERCIFGASCYRKNPQHLAEFSHPNNEDWGGGERGQCPWGSRCRRRDPRHWLHHDHPPGTHPPSPSNRQGMKVVERRGNVFYINAHTVNFYDDHFQVADSDEDSVDFDYEF